MATRFWVETLDGQSLSPDFACWGDAMAALKARHPDQHVWPQGDHDLEHKHHWDGTWRVAFTDTVYRLVEGERRS